MIEVIGFEAEGRLKICGIRMLQRNFDAAIGALAAWANADDLANQRVKRAVRERPKDFPIIRDGYQGLPYHNKHAVAREDMELLGKRLDELPETSDYLTMGGDRAPGLAYRLAGGLALQGMQHEPPEDLPILTTLTYPNQAAAEAAVPQC